MLPGMNPRHIKQVMKQLGMKQEEINASEVIIKTGNKEIIFLNPQVSKVNVMGQDTWQVVGEAQERGISGFNEDDVKTVVEQTGAGKEEAEKALKETKGDLAEAIIKLKEA